MISSNKEFQGLITHNKPKTFYGLSTDEKPITTVIDGRIFDIVNGSAFIEMDTSTLYFFDSKVKEWLPWGESSGGGDSTPKYATVDFICNGEYSPKKEGTETKSEPAYYPCYYVRVESISDNQLTNPRYIMVPNYDMLTTVSVRIPLLFDGKAYIFGSNFDGAYIHASEISLEGDIDFISELIPEIPPENENPSKASGPDYKTCVFVISGDGTISLLSDGTYQYQPQ